MDLLTTAKTPSERSKKGWKVAKEVARTQGQQDAAKMIEEASAILHELTTRFSPQHALALMKFIQKNPKIAIEARTPTE